MNFVSEPAIFADEESAVGPMLLQPENVVLTALRFRHPFLHNCLQCWELADTKYPSQSQWWLSSPAPGPFHR